MQFVVHGPDGYRVHEPAAALLSRLTQPVSVVGVAGTYRQGKSTLLNLLMGRRGFATSSSTQSQTKGLWLAEWQPGVLLLDCEGLASTEANDEHDFNLFALCVLLSSAFLYNNVGAITTTALQSLRLAGKLAALLRSANRLSLSDAQLVWVARDFSLQMVNERNEPIDSNAYFEMHIRTNQGVLELFPRRRCFTLPRPAAEDRDVLAMRHVLPEFTQGVQQLSRFLTSEAARPKQLNGLAMTGPMLLALVNTLVDGINQGQIQSLNLTPVWDAAVQSREREALAQAQARIADSELVEPFETLASVLDEYLEKLLEPSTKHLGLLVRKLGEALAKRVAAWSGELSEFPIESLRPALLKHTQAQLSRLQTDAQQLRSKCDELERLAQSRAEQHEQAVARHARVSEELRVTHETERSAREQRLEGTQQQLVTSEARAARLEAELKDLQEESDGLRDALAQSTALQLQLHANLARLEPEAQLARDELALLRDQTEAQFAQLERTLLEARRELESCSAQRDQLRSELQLQGVQCADREAKAKSELEGHVTLMCRLQQENATLQQEVDRLKTAQVALQTDLAVARAREAEATNSKRQRLDAQLAPVHQKFFEERHQADLDKIKRLEEQNSALSRRVLALQFEALTGKPRPPET